MSVENLFSPFNGFWLLENVFEKSIMEKLRGELFYREVYEESNASDGCDRILSDSLPNMLIGCPQVSHIDPELRAFAMVLDRI